MKHTKSYKAALTGLLTSLRGHLLSDDELVEFLNAENTSELNVVGISRELTPEETEIVHLDISCVVAFGKAARKLPQLDAPGPADLMWAVFLKAVGEILGKASTAICADAFAEAVKLGQLALYPPSFLKPVVHNDALCFAIVRPPDGIVRDSPVVMTGAPPDFDLSKWRVDKSKMN